MSGSGKRGLLALIVICLLCTLLLAFFLLKANPDSQSDTVKEFLVTVYHTHYEPRSITVQQGDHVRLLVLTSPGTATYRHGLTLPEYGIDITIFSESIASEVLFQADKPGTFVGHCASCADGPFGRDAPPKQFTLIVQ